MGPIGLHLNLTQICKSNKCVYVKLTQILSSVQCMYLTGKNTRNIITNCLNSRIRRITFDPVLGFYDTQILTLCLGGGVLVIQVLYFDLSLSLIHTFSLSYTHAPSHCTHSLSLIQTLCLSLIQTISLSIIHMYTLSLSLIHMYTLSLIHTLSISLSHYTHSLSLMQTLSLSFLHMQNFSLIQTLFLSLLF